MNTKSYIISLTLLFTSLSVVFSLEESQLKVPKWNYGHIDLPYLGTMNDIVYANGLIYGLTAFGGDDPEGQIYYSKGDGELLHHTSKKIRVDFPKH